MEDRAARRRLTAEWIRGLVGSRTLKDTAADIEAATGWKLDHSRLSRYANPDGTTHIGPDVVKHFQAYAKARRLPALDLTPPRPPLSLEERAVIAAERQADSLALIAWALISERESVRGAEPGQKARILAVAEEALARMTSPLPTAAPGG